MNNLYLGCIHHVIKQSHKSEGFLDFLYVNKVLYEMIGDL